MGKLIRGFIGRPSARVVSVIAAYSSGFPIRCSVRVAIRCLSIVFATAVVFFRFIEMFVFSVISTNFGIGVV